MNSHNFIDLTGLQFGRLTALSQAPRLRRKVPRWNCLCSCGKSTVVEGKNLRGGLTSSCGCLASEVLSHRSRTHGRTNTVEYKTWCGIKRRCYNPNDSHYLHYGGRGIAMSDEWRSSFSAFLRDMGPRPSGDYSIERIDTDGVYSAMNCKWLPIPQQANNKRTSVWLTLNGQSKTLADWSRLTGIPYCSLQARLKRGWTVEKTLQTPLDESRRNSRFQPKNLQAPPL